MVMRRRPTAVRLRGWARRAHATVGLGLGLLFVAWGLSGSVLVFAETLAAGLSPTLYEVGEATRPNALDAGARAVEAAFRGRSTRLVRLPREERAPYRFWLDHPVRTRVVVDAATGEIRRTAAVYGGPIGVLRDLHVHLFSGETGRAIVGAVGLFLISMVATGVWLWWPMGGAWRRALQINWRASAARRHYDLHRVVGVVAAIFLLVSALTGVALAYYDTVGALLRGTLGGRSIPDPPRSPPWRGTGGRRASCSPEPAARCLSGTPPGSSSPRCRTARPSSAAAIPPIPTRTATASSGSIPSPASASGSTTGERGGRGRRPWSSRIPSTSAASSAPPTAGACSSRAFLPPRC